MCSASTLSNPQAGHPSAEDPARTPGVPRRPTGPPTPRRTAGPVSRQSRSPCSSRARRWRAALVARSRTSARLPGRRAVRVRAAPSRAATQKHTVPTGFSSLPPSGPATPVIPIPKSASKRLIAPCASSVATSGETAPRAVITSASTPSNPVLAGIAVGRDAPREILRGAAAVGEAGGHQTARA